MRNYKIIEDYRYKGRNDDIVPCGIVGCNKGICYSVLIRKYLQNS